MPTQINLPNYVFTRGNLQCYFFEGPLTSQPLEELITILAQVTESTFIRGVLTEYIESFHISIHTPDIIARIPAIFAKYGTGEILHHSVLLASDEWELYASTPFETYIVGISYGYSTSFRAAAKQNGFGDASRNFHDYARYLRQISETSRKELGITKSQYFDLLVQNYADKSHDL